RRISRWRIGHGGRPERLFQLFARLQGVVGEWLALSNCAVEICRAPELAGGSVCPSGPICRFEPARACRVAGPVLLPRRSCGWVIALLIQGAGEPHQRQTGPISPLEMVGDLTIRGACGGEVLLIVREIGDQEQRFGTGAASRVLPSDPPIQLATPSAVAPPELRAPGEIERVRSLQWGEGLDRPGEIPGVEERLPQSLTNT